MYILRLNCDDKPGIVASVATSLSNSECNIEESSQYHDPLSNQFYMRVVFNAIEAHSLKAFEDNMAEVGENYTMDWQICDQTMPIKTLIMVSKYDHCLNDLLYRERTNHLPIDITAVVSNHDDTRGLVENHNLPFHHLPVTKATKQEQEAQVSQIIEETGSELIVMARYMQILSDDFCTKYAQRVINIHHSFLPSFKGAKPYHQAYERGVKITGATAHFATADLDEGPIIEQGIEPIDHSFTPQKMQALGQDTESRVLARAVEMYAERRIFVTGKRTIIL